MTLRSGWEIVPGGTTYILHGRSPKGEVVCRQPIRLYSSNYSFAQNVYRIENDYFKSIRHISCKFCLAISKLEAGP